MAVISEDFLRCTKCSNNEFKKEESVVLPKNIKKRYQGETTVEFPAIETHIFYSCTECGQQLDK